jgi:DNA-binding NtrC family response regulator
MRDAADQILVVDDESGIRDFLTEVLTDTGYGVAQASHAADALEQLQDRPFDLMLLDLRMPGESNGMDVLRRARAAWPELQIIVLTAHGTVGNAVEALRLGAFDFLEKPIESPDALRRLVARALNWRGAPAHQAALHGHPAARQAWGRGRLASLLWQLRRRHVYRVVAAYAAIAFLSLQFAELVLPALPVPSWLYRAMAASVLAGLPVAILLGWLYDITATGVVRTRASRRKS